MSTAGRHEVGEHATSMQATYKVGRLMGIDSASPGNVLWVDQINITAKINVPEASENER